SKHKNPDMKQIVPHKPPFKTSWLCGAIMLVRSSIFKEINGFDERFFLYFEETDLCKRISDAGYEIWANGEATAEHSCGESSKNSNALFINGCIAEHFYQSRYYFFKKHYGTIKAISYESLEFIYLMIKTFKQAFTMRKNFSDEIITRIKSLHL
ncbi:MAG: N-acetylglucosaminyl-diphospho-decaprenol L-rhamnosyltransferase, partial [Enterobacterales bacterium]